MVSPRAVHVGVPWHVGCGHRRTAALGTRADSRPGLSGSARNVSRVFASPIVGIGMLGWLRNESAGDGCVSTQLMLRTPGSGLGLAIVAQTAQAHRGCPCVSNRRQAVARGSSSDCRPPTRWTAASAVDDRGLRRLRRCSALVRALDDQRDDCDRVDRDQPGWQQHVRVGHVEGAIERVRPESR